ncbi:hypothetical protein MKK64_17270 [Methylobacterium sp. E-025]|uniref:hypothetical protein n=1 Tax=Methylobacterium sp. E-025 TaxID=2836561 RepID=UPI001FBB765A|nr:hypothetical protein [Methylobacterium sp. E-025]MCJ2112934.1 hypothetical protein [Methylobacterium sp. E-025]
MTLKTDGTTRLVLIFGGYALKIARHHRSRRCNRFEARIWSEATSDRRKMLCPVLACREDGQFLLMLAASALSQEEAARRRRDFEFPDWDYIPGGESEPFEYKASEWGKVNGRLVAVDYSAPALLVRGEDY